MSNKKIVLVLSDKGGTGKTLFSRGVVDHLIRNNLQQYTLFVDGDGEVGQLLQFYKQDRVISAQIANEQYRDQFVDILESQQPLIIVDLPAASITHLARLNDEIAFFQVVKDYGYDLIFCNVLSPFKAAVRSVKAMIELAGDQAQYVVVKNRFFGDDNEFHLYETGQGKQLLAAHQGQEIGMPKLSTGVLAELDSLNLPFYEAVESTQLKLAYRCRINQWLKEFDQEISCLQLTQFLTMRTIHESTSLSNVA
jgi:hypothetical protein